MWDACLCVLCGTNNTVRDCDCRVCDECGAREAKPGSAFCAACRGTCADCCEDCAPGTARCEECESALPKRARSIGAAVLLALLVAACSGRVSCQTETGSPSSIGESGATAELNTEPCDICVDPAATYCGDLDCHKGAFFCDLYGCFACSSCANPDALCAHARCLP